MKDSFSLGDKLRELRRSRAMSQEQVANIAEITTTFLGQVERGTKSISVQTLEKVCNALDVSLSDFFSTVKKHDKNMDDISSKILHQLHGKTESEKQAVLKLIKLVFSMQEMK